MMKNQQRRHFVPPRSTPVKVELETPILAGSVVDAMNEAGVKSAAQELQQIDASDASFNHEWE